MGYAGAVQSYSFDQAKNTIYRELVGGTKEVLITDRRPSGTAVIEAVTMNTIISPDALAQALATTRSSMVKLLATFYVSAHLRLTFHAVSYSDS